MHILNISLFLILKTVIIKSFRTLIEAKEKKKKYSEKTKEAWGQRSGPTERPQHQVRTGLTEG